MERQGKRKRSSPKGIFLLMPLVEVTEADTERRNIGRRTIRCGDHWQKKPNEEEEKSRLTTHRPTFCRHVAAEKEGVSI